MMRDDYTQSVAFVNSTHNASLSSLLNLQVSPSTSESDSCSSSQSSTSSQRSDITSSTSATSIHSDDDQCDSVPCRFPRLEIASCARASLPSLCNSVPKSFPAPRQCPRRQPIQPLHVQVPVTTELRRNPRRTSHSVTSRTGCPPSLPRQSDRKGSFVDNLVGKAENPVSRWCPTVFLE